MPENTRISTNKNAVKINDEKPLELGLSYREKHFVDLISHQAPISLLEILVDNFIDSAEAIKRLYKLREHYEMSFHSVSLSLGSNEDLDLNNLSRIKELIHIFEPINFSDHLSWSNHGGYFYDDLLPFPYTKKNLDDISGKVLQVQEFLGREILVENVSTYLDFKNSEMSEAQFLNQMCQRCGCGILFDTNNAFVNASNRELDIDDFVLEYDQNFVQQFHLAGPKKIGNILVDTHSNRVLDEVIELHKSLVSPRDSRVTILEWDSDIPDWTGIESELRRIEKICG